MLSTTYFLTAISVEQKKMQTILTEFKQCVQTMQADLSTRMQDQYFSSVEGAIKKFYQIEKRCHTRKVDLYLIPAIHSEAKETNQILREIQTLKSNSTNIYIDMQEQFRTFFEKGISAAAELCHSMSRYCEIQQAILTKEENELVPLAQQWLPRDVWFSISSKCLEDQEEQQQRTKPTVLPPSPNLEPELDSEGTVSTPPFAPRERVGARYLSL